MRTLLVLIAIAGTLVFIIAPIAYVGGYFVLGVKDVDPYFETDRMFLGKRQHDFYQPMVWLEGRVIGRPVTCGYIVTEND